MLNESISDMDRKIDNLKPSQSTEISRGDNGYCTVELSGDGKTLRFVRHTDRGFHVFKECRVYGVK